jgi:uncharacterized membrane protein YhiD involved in acid resistance
MAAGFGLYLVALIATAIALVMLLIVRGVEAQIARRGRGA